MQVAVLEIHASLSGNICRCTGYQPLVEAVRSVSAGHGNADHRRTPHRAEI